MSPEELLARGFSRETTIRRDRRGQWYHDGVPIERESISRAFDRWVDVADDGRTCLKNSINWAYCEIEGPPVFVRGVSFVGGGIVLQLSDDRSERLDPGTLRLTKDGELRCVVREARLEAGFTAAALARLADHLEETPGGPVLHFAGRTWNLSVQDD